MVFLANISRFNNVQDYLPIVSAVLLVDLFVLFLSNSGFIKSTVLKQWYKLFGLSAVFADILIIILGIILARYLYPLLFSSYSLATFILLALFIQVVHDILFYLFFYFLVPRGTNKMLDVFSSYAREVGLYAIISDSAMMISSCILASLFASVSLNTNIILFFFIFYLVPYTLYAM